MINISLPYLVVIGVLTIFILLLIFIYLVKRVLENNGVDAKIKNISSFVNLILSDRVKSGFLVFEHEPSGRFFQIMKKRNEGRILNFMYPVFEWNQDYCELIKNIFQEIELNYELHESTNENKFGRIESVLIVDNLDVSELMINLFLRVYKLKLDDDIKIKWNFKYL